MKYCKNTFKKTTVISFSTLQFSVIFVPKSIRLTNSELLLFDNTSIANKLQDMRNKINENVAIIIMILLLSAKVEINMTY